MKTIEISMADEWQRLDRYLRKFLPSAPLSGIYQLVRTGKIKIDGKRVDNEYRVEGWDRLELFLSDEQLGKFRQISERPVLPIMSNFEFPKWILHEDDSILVINKPPKINVHPGDHKTTEVSIIQLAHDYLWAKSRTPIFSPSLVHRIDRDTTGVLLIAKDRHGLNFLLDELQTHRIRKTYLAIAIGELTGKGTVQSPLLRVENAKNESKVRVDPTWQKAVTHYRSIGSGNGLSLLEIGLETGRMHQIRVHLSSVGHPLLGDTAYGNASANRNYRIEGIAQRQMLHAWELEFAHPVTRKKFAVTAPVPPDMRSVISGYLPLLWAFEAL